MHNPGRIEQENKMMALEDIRSSPLVSSIDLCTLDFQRGEWAGAEFGCHPKKGRAANFRHLWFLVHPDPKEQYRNMPSKIAILVRIMFSCYNKGPS